jgi:3-dehydroquinate synthase
MTSNKRWCVTHLRKIEYEVINSPGVFDPENTDLLFPGVASNTQRFVVVDSNVQVHFGPKIKAYFVHHGIDAKIVTFPSGEENKNLDRFTKLATELESIPIHRRDEPIIAIGGGTLTDVVGYLASSYRRSVPHIKVPTTVMGYVDAAIGIKNGINFNGHKNRLGSFEAPLKVLLDKAFFKTLPKRHLLNGLCEIIKLAVIKDLGLFELLEQHGACSIESQFQNEVGSLILDQAITGMLDELEPNLFEDDLQRRVDFGHTFSYGLEVANAGILHGEAVLLDIIFSIMLANQRGLFAESEVDRVFQLIADLGIVVDFSALNPRDLWDALEERTCHRNGFQRVPIPDGLGRCVFLNDIEQHEIEAANQLLNKKVGMPDGRN